jgi:GTP pyrophosphokinase
MYSEEEKRIIANKYRNLLRVWKSPVSEAEKAMVRKAFDLAVEAHGDMRRLSGEPYVYHPIEVAYICAKDMRLDATSIVCALLHDVVEDTEYTLEDIEKLFNPQVALIVGGVTKIKGIFDDETRSIQAEYFKKMMLALAKDMRVILIKLADRLHNMRTLNHMARTKQLKIASETLVLYAPLAYRMGLYNIKTELEDLSLKYTEPEIYEHIRQQLEKTARDREKFINRFIYPIKKQLAGHDIPFNINIRVKSIYSIRQKMQSKNISFDDVYDVFAVRIIIDSKFKSEKMDCWMVYSLITDIYKPKHDRVRDWVSIPKANGYEALHLTVMSNEGKWVEIQIRTKRMHEIAETGFASHHYYKNLADEGKAIESWLLRIREQFENPDSDALSFLNDFKLNLYSEEIYTFSPKGDMKKLPVGATVLDFAYNIHSEIGNHSIGAKVNLSLVPLNHVLKSGDQVEIITSKIQKPQKEWLDFVITSRAKNHIKNSIRTEKKKYFEAGKEKLKKYCKEMGIEFSKHFVHQLMEFNEMTNKTDLYYEIAVGTLTRQHLKNFYHKSGKNTWLNSLIPFGKQKAEVSLSKTIREKIKNKPEEVLLGEKEEVEYKIAKCCNPIPGDDVIGLIMPNNPIMIHRVNCKNAVDLMSSFGNRIVKAKWNKKDPVLFLAGIEFRSIDKVGLIHNFTEIISKKHHLKIRSFHLDSSNEVSEGTIMLYVRDTQQLNDLIADMRKIKEIKKISRLNPK